MKGELICGAIDLNDAYVVQRLLDAARGVLAASTNWHDLAVRNKYYFSTPDGPLPCVPGWYFICDGATPLYVGQAENLNARLNSPDGSRDNFANPVRPSDPARNFVKRYSGIGVLGALRVGISTPVLSRK